MNHYIAEKFFVYIGHDMPSDAFYSGQIGYARFVVGPNAYRPGNKFDDDSNDLHGFLIGAKKLLEPTIGEKP